VRSQLKVTNARYQKKRSTRIIVIGGNGGADEKAIMLGHGVEWQGAGKQTGVCRRFGKRGGGGTGVDIRPEGKPRAIQTTQTGYQWGSSVQMAGPRRGKKLS